MAAHGTTAVMTMNREFETMTQEVTDDAISMWERMYSFTHPGDLEGERIRLLIGHIRAIEVKRDSDYWYGLWKNVDDNLKEADQELMRRRMAIGGLLVAIGKVPATDLPPDLLTAIATARDVLAGAGAIVASAPAQVTE